MATMNTTQSNTKTLTTTKCAKCLYRRKPLPNSSKLLKSMMERSGNQKPPAAGLAKCLYRRQPPENSSKLLKSMM